MNAIYFFVNEGKLWLQHVQKVAHIDHFYIDGDK